MPAQPWVAGPTHLFWNKKYVGTAERTPTWSTEYGHVPLMNDLSGPVVPFDMLRAGKYCIVSADLTRWNYDTVKEMQAICANVGKPFEWAGFDEGTLLIHEDKAKPLNMDWPYSSKAAYSGMPPGLELFYTWPAGPDNWARMGTNPKMIHFSWYALGKYKNTGGTGGSFSLGEYKASGLPAE